MESKFSTQALVFGTDLGFYQMLKRFIMQQGIADVRTFVDPAEISQAISGNIWPIVFIDSSDDSAFDSLGFLDRFFATPGFELLSFVAMGSSDAHHVMQFARGVGARGGILRPLQPSEAAKVISRVLPKTNDPVILLALAASKLLLAGDFERARVPLLKLAGNAVFEKCSEVALLRGEISLGICSRAEERLARLLKRFPGDLRIYCEAANYFRHTTQHLMALRFLREVEKTNALPHRSWERACMALEIDDLDSAAVALDALGKYPRHRQAAQMGFAQLLISMGLQDHVPQVMKGCPTLAKRYSEYLQSELKAGKQ